MKHLFILFFILLDLFVPLMEDNPSGYPKNYFRSPVDFPIILAGGFGDVRINHFHSGVDIRTGGEEGKQVFAVADGYISRINISSGGFGKALYITHPNGFTSLYGHLRGFNPTITAWIHTRQYEKESFEIDTPVSPGILKIKKGELIAYSGNTGLSEGPHLHFEIRDATTQEIINPLLFGLPFKDNKPPEIHCIRLYPADENSLVNNVAQEITLPVNASGADCRVRGRDTVTACGNIIFGIQATDYSNDTGSRGCIASISLTVDTTCYFNQEIERFAFTETRYANSILDYPQVVKNGQRIMRSYVAPNNHLSMFKRIRNRGVVNFNDTRVHKVEYVISDASGNKSKLTFRVKSHLPVPTGVQVKKKNAGTLISCGKAGHFTAEGFIFDLPADALYEDLDFRYSESPATPGTYAVIHHLQNEYTPIHSYCSLLIKPSGLPTSMTSKALIVKVQGAGRLSGKGGKWENGFIRTQIREFGDYTVAVDTIPPVINPLNISPGKNLKKQNTVALKIHDNLSGIQSYRGTLNGKWILMDFDAKSGKLVYTFDDRIKPGKNSFRLVVKDAVGNESTYQASLIL